MTTAEQLVSQLYNKLILHIISVTYIIYSELDVDFQHHSDVPISIHFQEQFSLLKFVKPSNLVRNQFYNIFQYSMNMFSTSSGWSVDSCFCKCSGLQESYNWSISLSLLSLQEKSHLKKFRQIGHPHRALSAGTTYSSHKNSLPLIY